MREVVKTYPDDLDAATLFAESGMELASVGIMASRRVAREGTEEIGCHS